MTTMTVTSIRRLFLKTVFAAALLALPLAAIADITVTYHCEGEQTTEGDVEGVASTAKEHVAQDYTVEISKATARYWDWAAQHWRPIYSIYSHTLVLSQETVGPGMHGWWRLSIDRDTGAWSAMWAGGQHTTTIEGHCKQVALREPPR